MGSAKWEGSLSWAIAVAIAIIVGLIVSHCLLRRRGEERKGSWSLFVACGEQEEGGVRVELEGRGEE